MREHDIAYLTRPDPPALLSWIGARVELTNWMWQLQRSLPATVVRLLRGAKMESVPELFDEFAAALQFPDYFGENWPALAECLADLDWLPGKGYTLVVADAPAVLTRDHPAEVATFMRILLSTCEGWSAPVEAVEWARPALPFHVVFHADPEQASKLDAMARSAGVELWPLG